jgi:hypothetical protein
MTNKIINVTCLAFSCLPINNLVTEEGKHHIFDLLNREGRECLNGIGKSISNEFAGQLLVIVLHIDFIDILASRHVS